MRHGVGGRRAGRPEGQHAQQGHLQPGARVRGQRQFVAALDGDLVVQLRVLGRQRGGQFLDGRPVGAVGVAVTGHALHQGHPVQHLRQVGQRRAEVPRLRDQFTNDGQHLLGVARRQRLHHGDHVPVIDQAQHLFQVAHQQLAAAIGDGLVEQAEAVAHAAVGGAREHRQRFRLGLDAFRCNQRFKVADDLVRQQAPEIELQAARQNSDRDLLRVGGGEHELDVRRRLLERLEQRIEAAGREHVYFVDDVHLVTAAARCVLNRLQQFAHVIDAGARRGVDLDHVDEAPLVHVHAAAALAAGIRADSALAVQALGQDARDGGFADAAGAGEQERVVQAVLVQPVDQGLRDVLLADQLLKRFGAPLARQDLVTHAVVLTRLRWLKFMRLPS